MPTRQRTHLYTAVLCGALSLGLSSSINAATQKAKTDPVTGFVTSVGEGTVNVVKGVGHATGHVVMGIGHATGRVLTDIGHGVTYVGQSTVNAVEGKHTNRHQ